MSEREGQAGGNWGADLREGRPAAPFSGEMRLTGGPTWEGRRGYLWSARPGDAEQAGCEVHDFPAVVIF